MLKYYKPIKCKRGFTYSVDNLRLQFYCIPKERQLINDYFDSLGRTDVEAFDSTKSFRYRRVFTIRYDVDKSMTIGLGLNGFTYEQESICFIDFNPNKVANCLGFWDDLHYLKSVVPIFSLCRCDIAIDIPIPRERVFLKKDNRVYGLKQYSNINKTEYLGVRNNVGRVKLYNKQIESKLEYPLTRLEVTIDSLESWLKSVPSIFVLDDTQQSISKLNDTDFVLLTLLNDKFVSDSSEAVSLFNMLGRKKREKLAPLVLCEESNITFEYLIVRDLLNMVNIDFMS